MPDSETLSHTKWDCKYHVVFIPKYRRKALYHELRRHLGDVLRSLAAQKECPAPWAWCHGRADAAASLTP
jgi:putative transposase